MRKSRVYVLDYDLISPLGVGQKAVISGLVNQVSAGARISRFAVDGLSIQHGCEIIEDLSQWYQDEPDELKQAMQFDRKLELLSAAFNFMRNRLESYTEKLDSSRAGVIMGLGVDIFPFELLDKDHLMQLGPEMDPLALVEKELNFSSGPLNLVLNPFDIYSIYLAEKLQLAAFQQTVLTACAASTQAFILGCQSIERNETDLVLVGGTDSILNALALIGFSKLGVLAETDQEYGKSCKPFDISRNGTLAGEAAGLCVLVSEEYLEKTGLNPLFEVLGYGNTLDAYQITAPDPQARGMTRAISAAMKSSGLIASEIDYINLHGTGTLLNDPAELLALETVMGDQLTIIPISSTKDRHGHAIAAAGIQELAILFLCMEHHLIPSTLNLTRPVKDGVADFVIGANRKAELLVGMNNNFSFGGVNTSVVVRKQM